MPKPGMKPGNIDVRFQSTPEASTKQAGERETMRWIDRPRNNSHEGHGMLQAHARLLLVLVLALPNPGSGLRADASFNAEMAPHINPDQFRHALTDDNLIHWLHATSTSNGFYQTNLNRRWKPDGKQTATLVSQARLLHVPGTGYELTGNEEYREAVVRGADFLMKYFHDNKYNGWYWRASPQGEVLDDRKVTYGHAFAVFGLSHAYRATNDPRYREAALDTWQLIRTRLRDSSGGYVTEADRAFVTNLVIHKLQEC